MCEVLQKVDAVVELVSKSEYNP